MTNNTPTPAQALGEVMKVCNGPMFSKRAEEQAAWDAVNFIQTHGQHFAGLESERNRLREELAAQCLATSQQSQAVLENVAYGEQQWHRAEAAEARVREAEEMLAWFANNPYAYRIMADKCSEAAAFLAAKGESK